MFPKTKKLIEGYELEIKNLKEKLDKANKDIISVRRDYESEIKILNSELKIKVNESIESSKNQIITLNIENSTLKKEVEILEKAFENMGFDVKDMKDILNKLVDGIVTKNSINIVK